MRRCWPPKASVLQHCLLTPGGGGRCFRGPWMAATALTTCRLRWPGTMTTWMGPTYPCPVATRRGRMLRNLWSCRSPTCPCPARSGSQPCIQVAAQHDIASWDLMCLVIIRQACRASLTSFHLGSAAFGDQAYATSLADAACQHGMHPAAGSLHGVCTLLVTTLRPPCTAGAEWEWPAALSSQEAALHVPVGQRRPVGPAACRLLHIVGSAWAWS